MVGWLGRLERADARGGIWAFPGSGALRRAEQPVVQGKEAYRRSRWSPWGSRGESIRESCGVHGMIGGRLWEDLRESTGEEEAVYGRNGENR